jgi:hypothetical protein
VEKPTFPLSSKDSYHHQAFFTVLDKREEIGNTILPSEETGSDEGWSLRAKKTCRLAQVPGDSYLSCGVLIFNFYKEGETP